MTFAKQYAQERGDEIAICDERSALGWGELDDVLNRVCNALLATDLGDQHRIAVFAENGVETAFANMGGLIAGASVVPVNFHLTAEEAAYILTDSDARVLFLSPETLERGVEAARMAGIEQVVAWRSEPEEGLIAWDDYLAASDASEPPTNHPPRPNLLYTSGTTGRPKGTDLPPTMFAGGDTVAEHLENMNAMPRALGTHLVVGPMYHTGPLSGARSLAAGVPCVILGRFDAENTLRAIEQHRIETTVMVPTHFVRLLALPDEIRAKYDVSSLVNVGHTGAKCPVDVKRSMIEWWGGVFFDAYGASEVGTTCLITSEEWLQYPGSVGRAIPPFTALVLDDDDNEVAAGTEGRLYFKDATGRGVVYHNDPEKSAAVHIAPGVFTLGEIGYMNQAGYVFITDRFSDMILSGGVNIYPAEAEQVLIEHEAVADVACIGIPHPEMGEELKALVIPEHPEALPDAAELLNWVRDRLSHFKCPRSVDYVDSIGRNTMGKINKRKLRAPYWEANEA